MIDRPVENMNFRPLARRRRLFGFSLVEVLVATTVFSILSALLYQTFIINITAYHRRMAEANLWSEAQNLIRLMREDIYFADRVQIVAHDDGNQIEEIRLLRGLTVVTQYNFIADGVAVFERVRGEETMRYDRNGFHVIADRSFAQFEDMPVNVIMLNLVLGMQAPGGMLEIGTDYQFFLRQGMEMTVL